jgi:hypothetical protein
MQWKERSELYVKEWMPYFKAQQMERDHIGRLLPLDPQDIIVQPVTRRAFAG